MAIRTKLKKKYKLIIYTPLGIAITDNIRGVIIHYISMSLYVLLNTPNVFIRTVIIIYRVYIINKEYLF